MASSSSGRGKEEEEAGGGSACCASALVKISPELSCQHSPVFGVISVFASFLPRSRVRPVAEVPFRGELESANLFTMVFFTTVWQMLSINSPLGGGPGWPPCRLSSS
jgi:hypothetical protein